MGSVSLFGIIVFLGLQNKSGINDGYTINNSIVKCNCLRLRHVSDCASVLR